MSRHGGNSKLISFLSSLAPIEKDRKRSPSEKVAEDEEQDSDFVDKRKKGKSSHQPLPAASKSNGCIVDLSSESDQEKEEKDNEPNELNNSSQRALNPKENSNLVGANTTVSSVLPRTGDSSPVLCTSEREDEHLNRSDDDENALTQLLSQPVKSRPRKPSERSGAGSADEASPKLSGKAKRKQQLIGAAFEDRSLVEFGLAQRLTQHKSDDVFLDVPPPVHEEVSLSPAPPSSQTFCPVCKLNISTVSQMDRERHVNDCMEISEALSKRNQSAPQISHDLSDRDITSKRDTDDDDADAKEKKPSSTTNKASSAKPSAATVKPSEPFLCELCRKDITQLDLTRRQEHLNKCCDEYQSLSVLQLSQKSGSPVPPEPPAPQAITDTDYFCNICQKEISRCSLKARVAHLKTCAKKHGVQPDQFKNRRNASVSKPTPLKAAAPSITTASNINHGSSAYSSVVRSRFFAEPPPPAPAPVAAATATETKPKKKSRGQSRKAAREEEQVQIAMAISASLSDHQTRKAPVPSASRPTKEDSDEESERLIPRRAAQQSSSTTERLHPSSVTLQTVATTSSKSRKREVEGTEDEEPVSCTPALAPSTLAKKYAATRSIGGPAALSTGSSSSTSTTPAGGLWQTASSADLSSPTRVYVSGLLASVNSVTTSTTSVAATAKDEIPNPELHHLNQALRLGGLASALAGPASVPPQTPQRQPTVSSSPPMPLPQLPQVTSTSLAPPAGGTVTQRVQHILDAYATQCSDRRKVLEEKQRELKNWYLSEIGRLTLEKDDQLALLRQEVPANEVDLAAVQLQLQSLLPPLPATDALLRSAANLAATTPAAVAAISPVLPTHSTATVPATQQSSTTASTVSIATTPAPHGTTASSASVAATPNTPAPIPTLQNQQSAQLPPPTITTTILSQPTRSTAVPHQLSSAQKPPAPVPQPVRPPPLVKPTPPVVKAPPVVPPIVKTPAIVPNIVPSVAKSASVPQPVKPPPLKAPAPPTQKAPVAPSVKPAPPKPATAPAASTSAAPSSSTSSIASSSSSSSIGSSAHRPLVIDVVSPPPVVPEPDASRKIIASSVITSSLEHVDDDLCDLPESPTRPVPSNVLTYDDDLDGYTPDEMAQLLQFLDENEKKLTDTASSTNTTANATPAPPSTPPPASASVAANTSLQSPGFNDSILEPMLKDVPLMITPKAPTASTKAQADSVLVLTPPVADEPSHPDSEPESPAVAGKAPAAEARAIILRNPKLLDDWTVEELKAALEKLKVGIGAGSRQYMRYKLAQIAGLDKVSVPASSALSAPTASVSSVTSSISTSAATLLRVSSLSSLLPAAGSKSKSKEKEKATSDVDMDMKLSQLIKASGQLYEQMLQYERVELSDLQDFFKSHGLKVSKKILQGFCSSKGVLVRNTIKRKKAAGGGGTTGAASENDK